MQNSTNFSISHSSVETQRKVRIEKLEKLQELGINPFPAIAKRDFNLGFINFWFDFVIKHDFPGQIWQMQKTLDPRLDFHSKAVMANLVIHEAFEIETLEEAKDYTREWIETQDDRENLRENFEQYTNTRDQIIVEINKFLSTKTGYSKDQIIGLVNDYFKDADLQGEHKPAFVVGQEISLAGRVKSKRGSGKIMFMGLEDESFPEGFQAVFKVDQVSGSKEGLDFEQIKKLIEIGDYIQITGQLEYSQSGEPSIFVKNCQVLTKSILPVPENLEDQEQKYRNRFIDMKLNPKVREMFTQKSRFWTAAREFMVQNNFLEITMPTLEETTGGAEAEPFTTYHNALGQNYYLRISSELNQKRMIVGGFEKIFDIDKNFRNEGIDDEHLQEFTQLEFYWSYANYTDLMNYCEDLIKHVIKKTFGDLRLNYKNQVIDWEKPWPRVPYYEFVEKYGGIKLHEYDTLEKLQALCDKLDLEYDKSDGKGRLIDLIYKKTARPKCIEPIWLIDHPVEISPLAKRKQDNPELTERIQLIAYGSELANGFSELNDPLDQLARFQEQQDLREGGDDEAMMLDKNYIKALEIGMPPTAGFGFSERLFSVLMQKPIRETTPFPLMKREENSDKKEIIKTIHTVLLKENDTPMWQYLNSASHLSARILKDDNTNILDSVHTMDGEKIKLSIPFGIVLKQTGQEADLKELLKIAQEQGLAYSIFTTDMQDSKSQKEDIETISGKNFSQIKILGVSIFGEIKTISDLTKNFDKF
jgi:lysyl-tRNA synthetase, class II